MAMPATFPETRLALHRLAFYVVSPARRLATGNEIALSATPGGFGTPGGEAWGQVRVDGTELVVERPDHARRAPITSLQAAARLAGIAIDPSEAERFDVPLPGPLDAALPVDPQAAGTLAGWYALADGVLRELGPELAASEPRLWPEHFDLAVDASGGSWGFSPGDAGHDEPYVYVSLPAEAVAGGDPFWNATHFPGALLSYSGLRESGDARAAAIAFLRSARQRIAP
jgi:hypothetical protein